MKKFLFFISLLFVTVCYAAPPPDAFVNTDEVAYVADADNLNVAFNVPEQGIEAQEVAFYFIGNRYVSAGMDLFFETEAEIAFAELPGLTTVPNIKAKPPLIDTRYGVIIKRNDFSLAINSQHSNWGYPRTAD